MFRILIYSLYSDSLPQYPIYLLCQRLLPAPSSGGLCSFGSFNPSFDGRSRENIKLQEDNHGKPFNKRDANHLTARHESVRILSETNVRHATCGRLVADAPIAFVQRSSRADHPSIAQTVSSTLELQRIRGSPKDL